MSVQAQLRILRDHPGLHRFLLPNVRSTGKALGTGAYGSVEEVAVNGVVCAGKKIHETLLEGEANPIIVERYIEECQLMSDLRHPHIVQFLGICFLPPSRLPVLVMEKLHTSLDDLLERHTRHPPLLTMADIPLGLKKSMFVDIINGLVFLHHHVPTPVIHRDLTAKNVLLNSLMVAKISDLGNARIVDFQPHQLARTLSRIPGTPVYMPPEAFDHHSQYGPRLDIFSIGHLALYTIIQIFPGVLLAVTYCEPEGQRSHRHLLARTELERRGQYITQLHQQLGERHPLVKLVEDCLANDAEERPSAEDVLQRLAQMNIDDPYQNLTKLDMIIMVEQKEKEVQQASQNMQLDREVTRRNEQIRQMAREIQRRDMDMQRKEVELRQEQVERQSERQAYRDQVRWLQTEVERLQLQQISPDSTELWIVPRRDIEILGESEIGVGAWNAVSKGTFRGQTVAVKQMHKQILSAVALDRVKREISILARVRHPNIILFIAAVFDWRAERLQESALIITELLDTNLRSAYETGRIEHSSKLCIFRDIACGLNYLHQHHEPIIHRAVSTPNILLEALPNYQWRVKLSGFGSASLAKLASTLGEGSILYLAPETNPQSFRGLNALLPPQTTKIDVYSYGILLCEVLTNQLPVQEDYQGMLHQVQRQWPFMHTLIQSCTKRRPEERLTMADVLNELSRIVWQ